MGKSKNKITNWKQYNKVLEQRGSITFWVDDSAIDSGYHFRSLSETAMSRYKGLTNGTLTLRSYNGQVGEALANVKAINKVISLGMPERKVIA